MTSIDRRRFLKLASAAMASTMLPPAIRQALAVAPATVKGTIEDVQHVVILTQENRSFDHYFGTLRGVRGFGDPRPMLIPGGGNVFQQPKVPGHPTRGEVLPFRLNTTKTSAECMQELDHNWRGPFSCWRYHDAWIAKKTAMTMGYFTREDLPFYYALADAFTLCDGYHASIFGPTNPNRLHIFTGSSGLSTGHPGRHTVNNIDDGNWTADMSKDSAMFPGFRWTTYAERLQQAGISWRVYQEYDNYGDNGLAYFANFRQLDTRSSLYQRGRRWVEGSNADNAKQTKGKPLVAEFERELANGALPQISWIVAPFELCEHPNASPGYGESLVSRLLEALAAHPETWSKTVLLINYDENDGLFDHIPPAMPAIHAHLGHSSVSTTGENYLGDPVGLGIRVPLLVVSPWSRGGWVNSQVFDHTSIIQFLERRFGVHEPNIDPWRRAVAGDLTSTLDFAHRDLVWPSLPDTSDHIAWVDAQCKLSAPAPPDTPSMPQQEPGQRPSRALPYDFNAEIAAVSAQSLRLRLRNDGPAGVAFNVYLLDARHAGAGTWFHTLQANGDQLEISVPLHLRANLLLGYTLSVHGPNGFLRRYATCSDQLFAARPVPPTINTRYDAASDQLVLTIDNPGTINRRFTIKDGYAGTDARQEIQLNAGEQTALAFSLAESAHWYDFTISDDQTSSRHAGHIETGSDSYSDPAMGAGAAA